MAPTHDWVARQLKNVGFHSFILPTNKCQILDLKWPLARRFDDRVLMRELMNVAAPRGRADWE